MWLRSAFSVFCRMLRAVLPNNTAACTRTSALHCPACLMWPHRVSPWAVLLTSCPALPLPARPTQCTTDLTLRTPAVMATRYTCAARLRVLTPAGSSST